MTTIHLEEHGNTMLFILSIHQRKTLDQKIWRFILSPSYKPAYASMHIGGKLKQKISTTTLVKNYILLQEIRDSLDKNNGE